MIRAETVDLRCDYDGHEALRGVCLRIRAGEAVALVGANGSGKTTLLKALAGLLSPAGGQVLLAGRPSGELPEPDRFRFLGLVLQNPDDQLFAPTVAEDVAFGPANLDLPAPEVEARVAAALEEVGASALGDRPIHRLSHGEKRRAAIAGVLAMRPRLLLLDEPTAGLDPAGVQQVLGVLDRLRAEGLALLVATHRLDLLPDLAARACVLREGRVLADGSVPEILSRVELLREAGLQGPLGAAESRRRAARAGLRILEPRPDRHALEKHVLVCCNEDCEARGGRELLTALRARVKDLGLRGSVRITETRCLARCSSGPTMAVYPEGIWYKGVGAADAAEIVDAHLAADRPVARLLGEVLE